MPHPTDGNPAGTTGTPGRTLIGRYRIEQTLGRGGMGEVVLALDTLLNRRVALKRLHPAGEERAALRSAILKEARRASQINDRHIAALYDVLDLDDEIVLVMEYVKGETLRQRLAHPVPLEAFWDLATQCVEGVGAAHAHGVIHRDIKPENLMLTPEGVVKILDFGIAKRAESDAPGATTTVSENASQGIAGTPQYMAPEAHLGGVVDERTDIFSLGVVFYEMLTAKKPFDGTSYAAIADRVLNATPPPVAESNPAAGVALSDAIDRMLARDPAQRFASAAELMEVLARARLDSSGPRGFGPAPAVRAAVTRPAPAARPALAARAWLRPGLVALGIAVAVAAGLWWRASTSSGLPKDRNVAVLSSSSSTSDDFAGFALGAVDVLNARLRKHIDAPNFQITSFSEGLSENVHTAPDARKVLGANLALITTLEQGPDLLLARLELRDTAHDRVVASRRIQTTASQPFEFLDRTYRESAAMLKLAPRGGDVRAAYGIRGAGTLRFYLQGIGRLQVAKNADETKRAVGDLELACRTEPDAAVAVAALASAQHLMFEYGNDRDWLAKAEAAARQAVRLDSSRAEAHRTLAGVLSAQKNYAESLGEYTRAAELDPSDNESAHMAARTYTRLGQPLKERDGYLAVIQRWPHCWQPYWWLATWQFRQGNVDESIRTYQEMIRRAPLLATGYASLGGVLILRGEYSRAIETLKHSVELRPTMYAYDNLGTAYFNSGQIAQAVDAYNQAFQFGTADYVTWLNLGDAYFWLRNRKDDAAQAYSQAVRLGRDEIGERARLGRTANSMIPADLATVFPKLGQPDSARIYLRRALAADSTNPMVAYAAALAYWQLDEKDRALVWLEKSVRGGYPTVWLRDSPIFEDWRQVPEFRALVAASPEPQHPATSH